MKIIQTWKFKNLWVASRVFNDSEVVSRYAISIYGNGKTKKEAINDLYNTLIKLNKDIAKVVNEISLEQNN